MSKITHEKWRKEQEKRGNHLRKSTTTRVVFQKPGAEDIIISAVFENRTNKSYWWLETEDGMSTRSCYYEGLLTWAYKDRIFGYATHFWVGTLPIEIPFEISLATKIHEPK